MAASRHPKNGKKCYIISVTAWPILTNFGKMM